MGISQQEMAALLHSSTRQYQRWEINNTAPPLVMDFLTERLTYVHSPLAKHIKAQEKYLNTLVEKAMEPVYKRMNDYLLRIVTLEKQLAKQRKTQANKGTA